MKLFIITGLICLTAMIGEILRELRCFRVTRYTVRSPKLAGLGRQRKLIFLSDLHNYRYGENNDALYDAIAKEKPDLILIGGDMLNAKPGASFEKGAAFVKKCAEKYPVYYALGNHEYRARIYPKEYDTMYTDYMKSFQESGIRFLDNESCCLRPVSASPD